MNYLALRRRGAEIRNKQLLCFLFALGAFAPRREMLLIVGGFFRAFSGSSQARRGRAWAENMKKDFCTVEAGRLLKTKAGKRANSIAPKKLMKTNDLYELCGKSLLLHENKGG